MSLVEEDLTSIQEVLAARKPHLPTDEQLLAALREKESRFTSYVSDRALNPFSVARQEMDDTINRREARR